MSRFLSRLRLPFASPRQEAVRRGATTLCAKCGARVTARETEDGALRPAFGADFLERCHSVAAQLDRGEFGRHRELYCPNAMATLLERKMPRPATTGAAPAIPARQHSR